MDRTHGVITPERFASGMTFTQYLDFITTPENLKREGSGGEPRRDMSAQIRAWYEGSRLSEAQVSALKWLAGQPGGPAKILVISEEWSSDCRRDVPMLARMAEAASLDLRIFTRDGQRCSQSQQPSLAEAPDSNADLMARFMNVKNGQAWQSIPVAAFYTKDLEYLTRERAAREFMALQQSPFFRIWASAGVDEILSALYERLILGSLA